jgi:peptidoglycan/LPS O-acetylase OafA/YrhL
VDIHQNVVIGPTVVAIGAALFLLGSSSHAETASAPSRGGWFGQTIGVCGLLSYELYLFHPAFFLLVKPLLARVAAATGGLLPYDVGLASVVVALVTAAGWLAAGFSEPALRYLRRVFAPTARRSATLAFNVRTSQQ